MSRKGNALSSRNFRILWWKENGLGKEQREDFSPFSYLWIATRGSSLAYCNGLHLWDLKELRGGAKRNFFHDTKEFCCCGLYSVRVGDWRQKSYDLIILFFFWSSCNVYFLEWKNCFHISDSFENKEYSRNEITLYLKSQRRFTITFIYFHPDLFLLSIWDHNCKYGVYNYIYYLIFILINFHEIKYS